MRLGLEKRGFTLIELLVVISIIALLSSIVFTAVGFARERAKNTKARTEITEFIKAVVIAQGESSKHLLAITGQGCSNCVCRTRDIRNIPVTDSCYINWINAIEDVQSATGGLVSGLEKMTRDPWGSPYALDENEMEGGLPNCTRDNIRSAGPDGYINTADDITYFIPLSRPCTP